MIVYYAQELDIEKPRAHPWSVSEADDSHAYIDFKAQPELIRSSIEDLKSYTKYEFSNNFYSLIEWINSKQSLLESNDCAFRGAMNNTDSQFKYKTKCSGRIMILFRDLGENCQPESIDWLCKSLHDTIIKINPSFKSGAIGISKSATVYMGLSQEQNKGAKGSQVVLNLFAYGKNDKRCYENMGQLILCAHTSLERVNRKIMAGEVDAIYS